MQIEYYGSNFIDMPFEIIEDYFKEESDSELKKELKEAFESQIDKDEKLVALFKVLLKRKMRIADYMLFNSFRNKQYRLFHFLIQQEKFLNPSTAKKLSSLSKDKNTPIAKIEVHDIYEAIAKA